MLAWIDKHAAVFVVLGVLALGALTVKVMSQQGELHRQAASQLSNRVSNVATWCDAINQGRDYNRQFANQTLAQAQAQIRVIGKALAGRSALTPGQLAFLRRYLDSVGALERSVPQLLKLHPYTLPDLPCRQLERETLASAKR